MLHFDFGVLLEARAHAVISARRAKLELVAEERDLRTALAQATQPPQTPPSSSSLSKSGGGSAPNTPPVWSGSVDAMRQRLTTVERALEEHDLTPLLSIHDEQLAEWFERAAFEFLQV